MSFYLYYMNLSPCYYMLGNNFQATYSLLFANRIESFAHVILQILILADGDRKTCLMKILGLMQEHILVLNVSSFSL